MTVVTYGCWPASSPADSRHRFPSCRMLYQPIQANLLLFVAREFAVLADYCSTIDHEQSFVVSTSHPVDRHVG